MEPCNCNALSVPHLHTKESIVPYVAPAAKPAAKTTGENNWQKIS